MPPKDDDADSVETISDPGDLDGERRRFYADEEWLARSPFGSGTESSSEEEENLPPLPWYTVGIAAIASLTSANDGFDIGVGSGASVFLQEDQHLSELQVSVFFGSMAFLSAVGGLVSHRLADRWGRRATFVVSQAFIFAGVLTVTLASSFPVLMLGRALSGLGVGCVMSVLPMYIAETAPAAHRGRLTTWTEFAFNCGVTLGFVVNWWLRDLPVSTSWRAMVACGLPLPVVLVILVPLVMPESPRWLVARGHLQRAGAVLSRTNGPGQDPRSLVWRIESELKKTKEWKRLGYRSLIRPDREVRRSVFVALGIAFAAQTTGVAIVVLFAPRIFKQAGIGASEGERLVLSLLVAFTKMVFILIAASFVDTRGRRPLLVSSTALMGVSLLLLGVGVGVGPSWLAVAGVVAFVAAHSVGMGPIGWLYPAELFPSNLRARGVGLAVFLNRCTSGLMSLTFLPICGVFGTSNYFLVMAGYTALVATAIWVFAPETKQRSLEHLGARPEAAGDSSEDVE